MKKYNIKEMKGGWFIGNFDPSLHKTNDFEVALKKYKKNDFEKSHFHKLATEYTIISDGEVKMNNNIYKTGDIIVIKPFESTNFCALKDTTTVVVKIPGALNDKYLDNEQN